MSSEPDQSDNSVVDMEQSQSRDTDRLQPEDKTTQPLPTMSHSQSKQSTHRPTPIITSTTTTTAPQVGGSSESVPTRWESREIPPSRSNMSPFDGSGDSYIPDLTKMEPVDFQMKSELLDRLKQEFVGATSTKEGQLRELLLMNSMKAVADESASRTLLQLSGQVASTKTQGNIAPSSETVAHSLSRIAMSSARGEMPEPSQRDVKIKPDSPERPKKVRHKKRVNGKKICLVCGDKALAHNFDVITCESCKAFFRRNALKSQTLQRCMFQNNCAIDKNTRRFCPSCRLNKCFDIGMKAELMLDEEERRLRLEKKAQRIRQQAATSSTTSMDAASEFQVESSCNSTVDMEASFSPQPSSNSTPSQSFSSPDAPQHSSTPSLQPSPLPSFHTLRDSVTQSPSTASQSSSCSQNSAFAMSLAAGNSQPASTSEPLPFSSLLNQLYSSSPLSGSNSHSPVPQSQTVLAFAARSPRNGTSPNTESSAKNMHHQEEEVENEFHSMQEGDQQSPDETPPVMIPGPSARTFKHVPRDQLPSDPFMYWMVSTEERLMLANLTSAYQEVLLSLTERGLCRNVAISNTYFIHDFLNEIDDAMYKIVQFSKHIADFRQVRKEDQIAMLKSSAMHTLAMACCACYVHERDCWLSLRGDLTSTHLRKLTNDDPYIQMGVEFCRTVKSLVKNDFTVYALIHCMILFDPRDAKIVDRQIINQTRDKYVIMLKHYLESQYSYLFADEYFVAIQERVRELMHLAKSGNAMFKRYSSAFQPLITEMLSSG